MYFKAEDPAAFFSIYRGRPKLVYTGRIKFSTKSQSLAGTFGPTLYNSSVANLFFNSYSQLFKFTSIKRII